MSELSLPFLAKPLLVNIDTIIADTVAQGKLSYDDARVNKVICIKMPFDKILVSIDQLKMLANFSNGKGLAWMLVKIR